MVNDLELMTDKDVCAFLGCSRSFLKSRLNPAYQCKPGEIDLRKAEPRVLGRTRYWDKGDFINLFKRTI